MTSASVSQLLILYSWFPLAALIAILMLIARLYEKFAGERTGFRLFVIPLVLFGVQAVYTTNGDSGDLFSALLSSIGGLSLIALSVRLYWKMISHV